jgi:hypothetical protein
MNGFRRWTISGPGPYIEVANYAPGIRLRRTDTGLYNIFLRGSDDCKGMVLGRALRLLRRIKSQIRSFPIGYRGIHGRRHSIIIAKWRGSRRLPPGRRHGLRP